LVEGARLDREGSLVGDRVDAPAAGDAADVDEGFRRVAGEEVVRHLGEGVDRVRPAAVDPGVASRPADRDPGADAADGIDEDAIEAVPLERDECLGLQRLARRHGSAEVAEALLGDGEGEPSRGERLLGEQPFQHRDGDRDRRRVVAYARPPKLVAFPLDVERGVRREDSVHVRAEQEPRPVFPPRPQKVARAVARPPSRSGSQPLLEPFEPALLEEGRRWDPGEGDEVVDDSRGDRGHAPITRLTVASIAVASGTSTCWREGAAGTRVSGRPTRSTGASRSQKHSRAARAASSAPKPPVMFASWAMTSRDVRATDAATASKSSGASQRRSITSTSIPSSARTSAAVTASIAVRPQETRVALRPVRTSRDPPIGSTSASRESGALLG